MNLKPLGNRVLVLRDKEVNKTKGGIIIPDTITDKPTKGKVISISDEVDFVEIGNSVLFNKYGGTDLKIDDIDYLLVSKDDILGILKED